MNKRLKNIAYVSIVLFVAVELFARFYLGLGNPPLYIKDSSFEYIYAPNQNVMRFGNNIYTNEFSMRSKPLSKNDKIRILKIGDSIINGGAQTDQDSLASSILEKQLIAEFKDSIRVLNVGANSWGPDNAFEYVKKYGSFNASMIVLVFSSHDLHDMRHFNEVVGVYPAWPKEKPLCATSDGFFKYFIPWVKQKMYKNYNEYSEFDNFNVVDVNPGWNSFFEYSKQKQIPLLVYLHPTKKETIAKEYDVDGQELIKMFEENNINYILGLNQPIDQSCYRDIIHLNNKGQRKLAEALLVPMEKHILTQMNIN